MVEKIPIQGLDRKAWLELRKTGIGGSDAGAVCGLNPFVSPMKIFFDKTDRAVEEEESNEAIRMGKDLENYVADRFCEATGKKVRRSNYMYRSTENPFMIADVDRLIVGEDAGLECKTASPFSADKWKDDRIPVHYALQCFHYMAVTGKKTWYIAAAVLGKEFLIRRIDYDEELIQSLIGQEKEFWKNHVEPRKIPNPDGSACCNDLLSRYFGRSQKGSRIALVGFDHSLERREEIVRQIEALETEKSRIEQEVKLFMKENEEAVSSRFLVNWSNVDSSRLDSKKLKTEQPEIYARYTKLISSRRFTVRAA